MKERVPCSKSLVIPLSFGFFRGNSSASSGLKRPFGRRAFEEARGGRGSQAGRSKRDVQASWMELRSGPEGFVVCWLRRTVLGKHSQWIHSTKEPGALRSVGLVLVERNHDGTPSDIVGCLDGIGQLTEQAGMFPGGSTARARVRAATATPRAQAKRHVFRRWFSMTTSTSTSAGFRDV